jgi:D-arabinose 1-dehydrogenase-like Zn-dependent alcohol dehydrogenase
LAPVLRARTDRELAKDVGAQSASSPSPGTKVRAPYWGSPSELFEVLDLARTGHIHVETERFSLDDGPRACERMHAGTLRGRAVIVP